MIGIYLGFVSQPIGMVLIVMSFRFLCQALIGQAKEGSQDAG